MEAKSLFNRVLFISPLHLKTLLPRKGNDILYSPQISFSHYFRNVNKLCMEESLIMPKHFFIHILNILGEALTVQDNAHIHTEALFSSNFSSFRMYGLAMLQFLHSDFYFPL